MNGSGRRIGGEQWNQLRKEVLLRDNHSCVNCGTSDDLEVHHIVPVSRSGTNELSNLVSVCLSCHYLIHDKSDDGKQVDRLNEDIRWIPTKEELSTFINQVGKPLEQTLVLLISKTGIGVGELCNLTDSDVYLADSEVSSTLYEKKPNWVTEGESALRVQHSSRNKEYSSRRDRRYTSIIPIDSELEYSLKRWIALRPDHSGSVDSFFLSTSSWGKPISPIMVHHIVEDNARPLGMYKTGQEKQNLTPYTLRHFFIERFNDNSSIREYILGHLAEPPVRFQVLASQYRDSIWRVLDRSV